MTEITSEPVLREMARQLLEKKADWMSFTAGDQEKFHFVLDCQTVIKGLLGLVDRLSPCAGGQIDTYSPPCPPPSTP